MRRFKTIIVFICIALVGMRVSGAHLHYCFDGNEPPVTVHLDAESDLHHLNEHSGANTPAHSDVDVILSDDALVKKFDAAFDLVKLLLSVASILFLIGFVKPNFVSFDSFVPFGPRRANLRPPLRGPPR